jgi:DNA-3-methyladenine glycosylase I
VGGKAISRAQRRRAIAASEAMSRDLAGRGFKFVGATICYAFMQGVGMVNDHDPKCFRA